MQHLGSVGHAREPEHLVTIADAASLDLTTGMTIEAWVYPTAATAWQTIALKETADGLAYGLYGQNH